MSFMIGKSPIRRTLPYLNKCRLIFRDNVKIFTVHCNDKGEHHEGTREFLFWHLCQIQYKNPTVQCLVLKNMTPSPCIKIYFDNREPVLIDLESRNKNEIYRHLENLTVLTKTSAETSEDNMLLDRHNPNYFGIGCTRQCLCEVDGQIPCPYVVPLPYHWRGIPEKNPELEVPPQFIKWGLEKIKETNQND